MILATTNRRPVQRSGKYQQLALAIENQIRQRTNGRVLQLDVQVLDGTVIVSGIADSYYSKQLALEGIMDVLGSLETDIQLNVTVKYLGNGDSEASTTELAHMASAV